MNPTRDIDGIGEKRLEGVPSHDDAIQPARMASLKQHADPRQSPQSVPVSLLWLGRVADPFSSLACAILLCQPCNVLGFLVWIDQLSKHSSCVNILEDVVNRKDATVRT